MGVHGLWKLIEPSGKPIPVETLENKVLAVDVSIWLHQAIKGFRDNKGASVSNAHLLGIYHRVCKLLYFKIKPVFIFDGGVPALKRQTIAKRNHLKSKNVSEADDIQRQLISTLLKHTAISRVLSETTKASLPLPKKSTNKHDNLYELPSIATVEDSSSEDEVDNKDLPDSTTDSDTSPNKQFDLHTIDTTSSYFKSLPLDVKHEVLTDLIETRKQNSWAKLHQFPKQSDDFSSYQMNRLLKRKEVQSALDDVSKEMGGMSLSLAELESLLKDQGVEITSGKKIASDEHTRYLYIKNLQEEIKRAEKEKNQSSSNNIEEDKKITKADLEEEEDLRRAIQMSLEDTPSTSTNNETSIPISGDIGDDSDEELVEVVKTNKSKTLSSAQSYMLEYSGLSRNEVNKIINSNVKKLPTINESVEENSLPKLADSVCSVDDNEVEFISESSSSEDEMPAPKSSLEIFIDPNQKGEIDNLFSDIFDSEEKDDDESNKKEQISTTEEKLVEESTEESRKSATKEKLAEESAEIIVVEEKSVEENVEKGPFKSANNNKFITTEIMHKTKEKLTNTSTNTSIKTSIEQAPISKSSTDQHLIEENETVKQNLPNESNENNPMEPENNSKVSIIQSPCNQQTQIINPPAPKLTNEEMKQLQDNLQTEQIDLLKSKSSKERIAGNITDQMYQEAQELLELFGVPYVVAPMEAEAQCAFLDLIELTDGTITDDSDIWLFGGRTVYKNFFNQNKYVMEFKSENIEHDFKLSRHQMILLALLVGSDYTTGVQGVGPVTGLEILSSFPYSKCEPYHELVTGLREFKAWLTKGRGGRLGLKNKLKNVTFSDNFPSSQVVEAYLEPKVDTCRDAFSWSRPDVTGLTVFAREKFGWTSLKAEEILTPVIKKIDENKAQKSIKDYFKTKFVHKPVSLEGRVSKRVKTAVDRIGKNPQELAEEDMADVKKTKRKSSKKNVGNNSETCNETDKETEPKKRRKSKTETCNETDKETEPKKGRKNKTESSNETDKETEPKKRRKNKPDTKPLEEMKDLKDYQTIAKELKERRKRTQLAQSATDLAKKKRKIPAKTSEIVPNELKQDDEVRLLEATTSQSNKRMQEIQKEIAQTLEKKTLKTSSPSLHTKEIIHQKLKDKSDCLRNKLKAIETYRKSKKGPGYVPKKAKTTVAPKEDADLSEDSD
ncbi:unnamed protein product [Phyllotreta striolata]|uniref:Uncharacterized protein n=1 Tax=Phyllotreta striolata TaxID=444603 RepID=A0A9N9XR67_PHYSR|nr:unnamed protein product [Phyllotreta striolata]